MTSSVPPGARPAARILLINASMQVLLLEAAQPAIAHRWWVAPGGGLLDGESFEQAAARELREETGLALEIGPWVWTRHHIFNWEGRRFEQYERFFVARTTETRIQPVETDSYILGHRWWSLKEIESSSEDFAPRRLAELISPIAQGEYPRSPIDCGV